MESQNIYKVKISPEFIKGDIFSQTWSGDTFGVYSGFSEVLSGGTGGSSLLQDVSVPILLTQNAIDIGYYSVFDGYILQKDITTNFLFIPLTASSPYNNFKLFNTSDVRKKFLDQITFILDWGDGTGSQIITNFAPTGYTHQYLNSGTYEVKLSANTDWGLYVITKKLTSPFVPMTIPNPDGTAIFPSSVGNWTATPTSYNYIFSGDADCDAQIIQNVTIPFLITGYTKSNLKEMKQYGNVYPTIGVPFSGSNGDLCVYLGSNSNNEQTYTINGITYVDYPNGQTIFFVLSSGCTLLDCQLITKEELLMNVIEQPQVNSDVFIERGNNTGTEYINRLGEVDNMGDLIKYGYKFFKIQEY